MVDAFLEQANGTRDGRAWPVADVLAQATRSVGAGESFSSAPRPTGFSPLDDYLDGGLRDGELALLGGPQGLGKTVMALQIARNVVAAGGRATYVCYEHDVDQLLERLLAMEARDGFGIDAPELPLVRRALRASAEGSLDARLGLAGPVVRTLDSYGDRLRLVRASGARTGVDELRQIGSLTDAEPPVLVVDYLQKVHARGVNGNEDERVTAVVESLKDLALDLRCPVLAIVAADKSGLAGRTRLGDLRGSTALAYEADVALLLNEKFDVVARQHLMFGTSDVERFHDWVVCTIEKNRNGVKGVELEFEKQFAHSRFDPRGRVVGELLADERLGRE